MTSNASIRVRGRSRAEIQRLAERFRELMCLDGTSAKDPFPIVNVIETLAAPIDSDDDPLFNFEVCEDSNPSLKGAYALYDSVKQTMYVRESVYDGAVYGVPRDRFTLAHELGHCLLGHGTDYKFARADSDIPAYENPEWQANTFASMLLIPRHEISGMLPWEIAKKYKVSYQAAEIALQSKKANPHCRAN